MRRAIAVALGGCLLAVAADAGRARPQPAACVPGCDWLFRDACLLAGDPPPPAFELALTREYVAWAALQTPRGPDVRFTVAAGPVTRTCWDACLCPGPSLYEAETGLPAWRR